MLYTLSVLLHVVAACVWVGGLLFFVLVLGPLAKRMPVENAAAVLRLTGQRFRAVGTASLAVLVVTGFGNLLTRWAPVDALLSAELWRSTFGVLLGIKLALVAVILLSSSVHSRLGARATELMRTEPGSVRARRWRKTASWLGRMDAVLALAVVTIAVMLIRGVP